MLNEKQTLSSFPFFKNIFHYHCDKSRHLLVIVNILLHPLTFLPAADKCAENDCDLQHSQCVDVGETYTCLCDLGWEGRQCDVQITTPATPDLCDDNACHPVNSYCLLGACICYFGWTGLLCDVPIPVITTTTDPTSCAVTGK